MTALPGAYALILHATDTRPIAIGRLGEMTVRPGYYVYVGSALGPGGLGGRLRRHLSGAGKLHWHVDYLRQVAEIVDIWHTVGAERHEHVWAHVIQHMAGATIPMRGFGASDCACAAHLFHFADVPSFASFRRDFVACTAGAQPIDTSRYPVYTSPQQ